MSSLKVVGMSKTQCPFWCGDAVYWDVGSTGVDQTDLSPVICGWQPPPLAGVSGGITSPSVKSLTTLHRTQPISMNTAHWDKTRFAIRCLRFAEFQAEATTTTVDPHPPPPVSGREQSKYMSNSTKYKISRKHVALKTPPQQALR
jgi:hypothetical protein